MRRGYRRTGRVVTTRMPVVDRFEAVRTQRPAYGYVLESVADSVIDHLRLHGLTPQRITADTPASLEVFTVDSVTFGRAFQGHREASVTGSWSKVSRPVKAGSFVVRMGTPLDLLAMQLLEPQGDDGLLTWNAFDAALGRGREFPVYRLAAPLR